MNDSIFVLLSKAFIIYLGKLAAVPLSFMESKANVFVKIRFKFNS